MQRDKQGGRRLLKFMKIWHWIETQVVGEVAKLLVGVDRGPSMVLKQKDSDKVNLKDTMSSRDLLSYCSNSSLAHPLIFL